MKIRHTIAGLLAASLLWTPARADLPVVDAASLLKWVQQAQQMQQSIAQLEAQLKALTDIPQNLTEMVQGLLNSAVSNPLGAIEQNLQTLLSGQGTGTCAGSQTYLTQNQYFSTTGTDFVGQAMNQSANRSAGLQACTQQMMVATQARLAQMPQLLTELQGATDVTQATAISGRIQIEIATINAQQQQAMLLAQSAMLQESMRNDQILQKQRADAQEIITNTSPGAAGGNIPAVTPAPQPFVGN